MAFPTNALIEHFEAEETIATTTATVNSDAFSVETEEWTNTNDAMFAALRLETDATDSWSAAPTASEIHLYAGLQEIDGTDDEETPSSTRRAHYLGTFIMDQADTQTQQSVIRVQLPNMKSSQVYRFIIHNQTGVNLLTGWDLYITPITVTPKT